MAKRNADFVYSDLELVKKTLRDLHDVVPLLDKAEACGVECSGFRAIRDELVSRLSAIDSHFLTPLAGNVPPQ